VILYYDPGVQYGGKLVGGMKVKVPKAAMAQQVVEDDDDLV
jgi:hypothetical protein